MDDVRQLDEQEAHWKRIAAQPEPGYRTVPILERLEWLAARFRVAGLRIADEADHSDVQARDDAWDRAEARQRSARKVDAVAACIRRLPEWPVARSLEERERYIDPRLRSAVSGWVTQGPCGLILLGQTGSGKTTAVVHVYDIYASLRLQSREWPEPLLFVRATELSRARKNNPLGKGEPELLGQCQYAPLLCIDDLGQEDPAGSVFHEILDARYEHSRPTIITSGLRLSELDERYGPALLRRVVQVGQGILAEAFDSKP